MRVDIVIGSLRVKDNLIRRLTNFGGAFFIDDPVDVAHWSVPNQITSIPTDPIAVGHIWIFLKLTNLESKIYKKSK